MELNEFLGGIWKWALKGLAQHEAGYMGDTGFDGYHLKKKVKVILK